MAYCGYITRLKNVRKHPNADRLQLADCFGNTVIIGLDNKEGQLGVYFPVDGQLSVEFCAANDLVRRKDGNGNPAGGYLDPDKRNIKAMKLRGEKSDGLFLPMTCLASFTTISDLKEGDTITTLNGVEICHKYIPRSSNKIGFSNGNKVNKTKVNFAPTFYEHVDTAQLVYNLDQFKSGDIIELTLKMHGTSGRTGHLPLLKNVSQNFIQKLFHRPIKQIKEYGYVTGTRRVVLDNEHDGGFYNDNTFRRTMAAKFENKLHKGEVAYYEIVGFVNETTPIMASVKNSKIKDKEFSKTYGNETVFSYGCDPAGKTASQCDIYVYRMTMVNEDGDVVEYSPDQMRLRCDQMGIKYVPLFERFMIPDTSNEGITPGEYVVRKVEEYFDGPDPVGKTHIREGVVARIINRPNICLYKHKNFNFKVLSNIAVEQAVENGSIDNMSEDLISEL